jgi:adenosine deaminase
MESDNMKEFITNLPKAELHLHIEGTLSPQTILKLAARNNIDFPYKSVEAIKEGSPLSGRAYYSNTRRFLRSHV